MSEQASADNDDAEFDEAPDAADEAPEPSEKPKRPWFALAALALALISLAASGLLLVSDFRDNRAAENRADSLSRLSARLDESRDTLSAVDDSVGRLDSALGSVRERIDALEAQDSADILGTLPNRVGSLERNVSMLSGVADDTRDAWLVAEAEYYLQIANAQIELARNPELAAAALRQADSRLVELANPAYTDVRARISDELQLLELVNEVDVPGMTLTLASLSRVVDSLPVRIDDRQLEAVAGDEPDPDVSGVERAWQSVKSAASGLVRVTTPDDEGSPLLSPDAVVLLRANLSLQLQAARLAILKGEREVFEQSLEDAADWIVQYFDTDSVQVDGALETIRELRNSPAMGELPSLSGSLSALRRARTLDNESP